MSEYQEIVKGRIVDRASGSPVKGARVEVYDKDMVLEDYLGFAITDGSGRFEVDFTTSEFKHGPFEGRPDIFLKVLSPVTGKHTKSKVYENLRGQLAADDSVEVMDLGDTPID